MSEERQMQKYPILLLATLAACSSGGASPSGTSAPRADRNVITRAQIESANAQDMYEVIQRLRPEYLRAQRGTSSMNREPDMAVVYVNGVRQGEPGLLRAMRPAEVEEVRFINAADATTRFGTGHAGGVIEVKTRSGRDN
jgi:hypothetical protein